MKRKILGVILTVSMCLVLFTFSGGATQKEFWNDPVWQLKSGVSSLLHTNFIFKHEESIGSTYGNDIFKGVKYPDEYAGAFMNEDGSLTVYLTNFEAIEKYKTYFGESAIIQAEKSVKEATILRAERMGKSTSSNILDKKINVSEQVKYEIRTYSFSYLSILQERLSKKMEEFSIVSIALDEKENVLHVGLKDYNMKKYIDKYLSELGVDQNLIDYYQYVGKCEFFANNARNGTEIRDKTYAVPGFLQPSPARGSIGFHASNSSGQYGVVTAAHVLGKNVTAYNENGKLIGTSSNTVWGLSGKLDFVFVPYDISNINRTSLIDQMLIYAIEGVATPTQGMYIQRYGFNSGMTGEHIKASSVTETVNGVTFNDFFTMGNSTGVKGGDSGGPVVFVSTGCILGIISFGNVSTGTVYCPKVSNFVSTFNMTVLTGSQWAN